MLKILPVCERYILPLNSALVRCLGLGEGDRKTNPEHVQTGSSLDFARAIYSEGQHKRLCFDFSPPKPSR